MTTPTVSTILVKVFSIISPRTCTSQAALTQCFVLESFMLLVSSLHGCGGVQGAAGVEEPLALPLFPSLLHAPRCRGINIHPLG
jgi:hypothetical protein